MKSFQRSLIHIIPDLLLKLYMINNGVKDNQLMSFVIELSKTIGLETLVMMQNNFG